MSEFTVQVSGCDASTAMKMELDQGELALLREIHNKLNERKRACAPTLSVYVGDVLQYECEEDENWNPIPGTEKPTGDLDFGATLIPAEGFDGP